LIQKQKPRCGISPAPEIFIFNYKQQPQIPWNFHLTALVPDLSSASLTMSSADCPIFNPNDIPYMQVGGKGLAGHGLSFSIPSGGEADQWLKAIENLT